MCVTYFVTSSTKIYNVAICVTYGT